MMRPRPNLIPPGGLYLVSQILDTIDASAIIKREFRILNQVAGTSLPTALYSLHIFQITSAHTHRKLMPNMMFEAAIFFDVSLKSLINTQLIITEGTTVRIASMILNAEAALPISCLSVKSRAKITSEEAPCSKDSTKNTVKNTNMITTIIRSRITFS